MYYFVLNIIHNIIPHTEFHISFDRPNFCLILHEFSLIYQFSIPQTNCKASSSKLIINRTKTFFTTSWNALTLLNNLHNYALPLLIHTSAVGIPIFTKIEMALNHKWMTIHKLNFSSFEFIRKENHFFLCTKESSPLTNLLRIWYISFVVLIFSSIPSKIPSELA